MSAPAGYYNFKVNSLDANGISFYFSSLGGGSYFNAQLFTASGATLISWPNLLVGNESVGFHGLVQLGQSYILVLQGNNDPSGYVYETNISIPANAAPPSQPFTPGITGGGYMSNLSVESSVTWNTDGTGVATLIFSPNGTGGIAQIFVNGVDQTHAIGEANEVDLLNLSAGPPVTLSVPLQNASSTIQVKTLSGMSWTGLYNSPGPVNTPITQTVTGNFFTSDQRFLGITLPGYGWGIAAVLGFLGLKKVFKK